MNSKIHTFLLLSICALFLNGCAGYRLGSTLTVKSVYVPTVTNNTDEPFLETEITRAIRDELQREGSLRLESENEAESTLIISVNKYELTAISTERTNRSLANEFRVDLVASVKLVENSTGRVIMNRSAVRGDSFFEFAGDLVTARRTALPKVSDDLANDIVSAVVEAW